MSDAAEPVSVQATLPGGRRPLMSDVARLAGVSLPTVSRVLNGGHWVHADTAERVRGAIEQLGYRPNATARALARGGADVLGVLSHATGGFGPTSLVSAVEQAARRAGYTTMLATVDRFDAETVQRGVERMVEDGAAGIVVAAIWTEDATAVHHLTSSVPLVIGEHIRDSPFPTVGFDEVTACRLLVEHLLDLGHRTVHHVAGQPGWSGSVQREEGWRSALEHAGAPVPEVIPGDWSSARGYQAAAALCALGDVTAVFAANDQTALGVIAGLHAQGVRVPDDVSVAGFDACPDSAFYLPALTTIRNDYSEYARQILACLLSQLGRASARGPASGADGEEGHLVAAELLVRASTAPVSRAEVPRVFLAGS